MIIKYVYITFTIYIKKKQTSPFILIFYHLCLNFFIRLMCILYLLVTVVCH